jgi:small subunit ribosomal protein S2
MAETTPPTETPAAMPPPAAAAAIEAHPLTVRALLEAGAHFGHQTHRWSPKMKPFIFGERNGIHIIDLDQTLNHFQEALEFLRETTAGGGKVLFVGTKRQAQAPVQLESARAGQYYVNNRWLGGMLTNFRTVRKSLDRFKELLGILEDEAQLADLTKKEQARMQREVGRYRKALEGLKEMTRLPEALFVIDVKREHIAISEAQRLGIPIVAVVDSNCDPTGIDFAIPANDDATRAIQLYCQHVASVCLEGDAIHEERVRSEVAEQAGRRSEEAPKPGTGRVVVEIKQPPRRGRGASRPHVGGTHSHGGRSAGAEAAPAQPAAAAERPPVPASEEAAESAPAESAGTEGGAERPAES